MNRRVVIILLLLILMTAGLLRAFNVGHTLEYDEAWNAVTVADGATGHTASLTTQGLAPVSWFDNFYRHPPVYLSLGIAYSWVTGSGRFGVSIALEILSIIAALVLVLIVFLCGRDWFDEYTGLAAAFVMAVMPAARMMDSLIKSESVTLALAMLFLLLFFRKRYWIAGVALGLAFLTKEVSIFIPVALALFVLIQRRWKELKGFAVSLLVAIVASFWWYVFFSRSSGEFTEFFFGRSAESVVWHKSWSYYFSRIPSDLGWPALILLLAGIALAFAKRKQSRAEGKEFSPVRMAQFCLLLILLVYVAFTFSYGKPPWMIYTALPAVALVTGWALVEVARMLPNRKVATAAVVAVLVLALALSTPVSFGSFMKKADLTYAQSVQDRKLDEYIHDRSGSKGTMIVQHTDVSPVIAFYLQGYRPGSMIAVPASLKPGEADLGKYSMFLMYPNTSLKGLASLLDVISPGYLVLRQRSGSTPNAFTAAEIARLVRPEARFGDKLLWIK